MDNKPSRYSQECTEQLVSHWAHEESLCSLSVHTIINFYTTQAIDSAAIVCVCVCVHVTIVNCTTTLPSSQGSMKD